VVQGGGAVSGRWRRTSIAGVAGIARSRVSRAARRSAAGKNGRERDQLELAFEGNPATVAPESVPPEFRVPASSRYSVIAPIPVPPPSPAKPRRLVPLRAVPAAYVVPSVIRGGASQRGGRLLGSRLRSTLSAAYRELRLFVAPPTPGVRLQPVLSNPATTARLAPELRGFRDRSSAASARSGADRGGSEWGEQLALAGGLLAAIALAWFLG